MQSLEDITVRFDIDPSHTLKQQNSEQMEKELTHYETRWYVEKDEQERVVARYRGWTNQSLNAPYRTQVGWERYSADGMLLEREVRYLTQDEQTQLH